jgi:DNA repair exonuclease SbcCD ATPase subunit
LKANNADAGLTEAQWDSFKYKFAGDVKAILDAELKAAQQKTTEITGPAKPALDEAKLNISFIKDGVALNQHNYNVLRAEQERLQKLIGMSEENAVRIKKLSEKIAKGESTCAELGRNIEAAEAADGKISEVTQQRRDSYKAVFETLLRHEEILTSLYKPLMDSLDQEEGTLGKLTFDVRRVADAKRWAEQGESLLDLRKAEAFRGTGALQAIVEKELVPAWESGTADDVSKALAGFVEKYEKSLREHSLVASTEVDKFREWASKISAWLYGTDHISINYGVQYDGIEIQQLSPGTRGIVLLLLYLAIDKEDYRPLIIDQPEENLDPKSIFDELVPRFKAAKLRRQIIIVTHNANLVVNTDADQVIIASCGTRKNQLPEITYLSGGLENSEIRAGVCEILEGGEEAFKERAKRLRVYLH